MKKFITLLVSTAMLASMTATTAFAEETDIDSVDESTSAVEEVTDVDSVDENASVVKEVDYTKLGDAFDDGTVDLRDAIYILQLFANNIGERKSSALAENEDLKAELDVNFDGNVDAIDAVRILQYYSYSIIGGEKSLYEFSTDYNNEVDYTQVEFEEYYLTKEEEASVHEKYKNDRYASNNN
jgi:hypothetical protein